MSSVPTASLLLWTGHTSENLQRMRTVIHLCLAHEPLATPRASGAIVKGWAGGPASQ
jgi:hypothetical protein